jgi:hypothetical protein
VSGALLPRLFALQERRATFEERLLRKVTEEALVQSG